MCCSDEGVWVKKVSGVTPPNDYNNVTTRSVAADDMAVSPGWSFKYMHWRHARTSKNIYKKNFFLYVHTTNTENIGDKSLPNTFFSPHANSSETLLPEDDQSICQLRHGFLVIIEGSLHFITCQNTMTQPTRKYHVVIEMCGLRKAEYGNKGRTWTKQDGKNCFAVHFKKKIIVNSRDEWRKALNAMLSSKNAMQVQWRNNSRSRLKLTNVLW